jgi:hypothetical protein
MTDAALARDEEERGDKHLVVVEDGVPLPLVGARDTQPTPALLVRGKQIGVDMLLDHNGLWSRHILPLL